MNNKKLPTEPHKAMTANALFRQLLWIALLYAGIATLGGSPLLALGANWTARQLSFLVTTLPIISLIILAVDGVTLAYIYRPVRAGLEVIESGRDEPILVQQALIQTLNLPLLTFARVMGAHAPTAIISSVCAMIYLNINFDTDFHTREFIVPLLLGLTTAATAHAILEYFAVLKTVRPVIPFIRKHAGTLPPDLQDRIVPINIRQRLLFIAVSMTFIPVVVLGVSVVIRADGLLQGLGLENTLSLLMPLIVWIVGLVVVVTAFMVGIALAMSQDVHQLAGDMVTAMRDVEAGDINTHLDVTSTDEFAALYTGFNSMTRGLRERERLHDAFGRYISPELAEQVMAHGVSMSGKSVTASVLFVDIRDYTALSERMTAPEIIALLNRYFARVEPVIKTEGGWINKFTGDGFMALFGVPVPHNDHAQRAVRAALAICQALDSFNQEQRASDGPVLRIGVGIACGEMVAGSIGSPDRIEYTVIGDTVNVAARIESLNKELGTTVLVSDGIYQAVQDIVDGRAMPPTMVKGKSAPVQVYALS